MFSRISFWLGLLIGGLASFGLRAFWLPESTAASTDPLLDSVSEAIVVCDASGAVTYSNPAAQALLGPQAQGIARLCYPSGQKVPLGQLPLNRALRTGKAVSGAGYLFKTDAGTELALEVRTEPLPDGGVAATIRDVTAQQEGQARETTVRTREQVLRALCRRLNTATDAAQLARAVAESALALGESLPDLQVRLYTYDSDTKQLTRLASAPEGRSKARQKPPLTFPWEAASPLLWKVYVERQPYSFEEDRQDSLHWAALGEEVNGSAYVLPLLAGSAAAGHLSFLSSGADAFADEDVREAFHLLASVAALALAGPQQAAQTAHLAEQVGALREVVQAVGGQKSEAELADLVSRHVRRVTGGEVCTVAWKDKDGLRLAGTDYQDALVFPERHTPHDPALWEAATTEAVHTGKTVQRIGRPNPRFEEGLWRAFAGQSGKHSILALPLGAGQGALTVWVPGESPFPEAQITFLETVAALLTAALSSAIPTAEPSNS